MPLKRATLKNTNLSRREFVKGTVGTATALATHHQLPLASQNSSFDAKGLPTRVLGNTGVKLPLIGLGTGSRFCSIADEDQALEILTHALNQGLYYWDTAHSYRNGNVISEERLGKIAKERRSEIFLATKVDGYNPEEVKKQIEVSLQRLQTDYVDLIQAHSLKSLEDVDALGKKGGVLDLLRQMREEGITHHIGFTGHTSARVMQNTAEQYDFETMLIALNHFGGFDRPVPTPKNRQPFEQQSVPAAAKKGLGVIVMKVIRPRETVPNLDAAELIRYALSLKNVTSAVIGIESLKLLKQNLRHLKHFQPMNALELQKIRTSLRPFLNHDNLDWMDPDYKDGLWS